MTAAVMIGSHRYGVRWMRTWPHVSLGLSVHLDRKFGHLSIHLPIGVIIVGFIGADFNEPKRAAIANTMCRHGRHFGGHYCEDCADAAKEAQP